MEDMETAVAAGADALGFLVGLTHFSEDKLEADQAGALIRHVPPFVQAVLVTHLVSPREIADLASFLGVNTIQLHGEMTTDSVAATRELLPLATLVRSIHVTDDATDASLKARLDAVAASVDGVLLDSRTTDRLGGTGRTHNWGLSRGVAAASPVPVVLAGGLTPANVVAAIHEVRPFAVDVNSGVETATGDKSRELCVSFVANALAA
jgi:phosphoribosylanthranilate isomerase